MELFSVSRFNLALLLTIVLNVALAWAAGATLEQAQSHLPDSADEDLSYYRQPLAVATQERVARSGANGGKVPFYPSYRFGSIRLITPYALQHLLSSRFQNTDYPGKRMGSEFLGKKRSNLAPLAFGAEESGHSSLDSAYEAMEKKMGSEFLGRRKRSAELH